jgi:hypothetical protein
VNLWRRLDCIYADDRLGQTERHLAAYLAFRVNQETMTCRLGAGTIASGTGFDRRTVQRIVNRLERLGLVSASRSGKYQGRNAANLYTLHLAKPDPEIAAQRRYSPKKNSGTDDTGIAAPVHGNSGTAPHKPVLTVRNRGARGERAPDGASPRAQKSTRKPNPGEESAPAKRRRQLLDLARVLNVPQRPGEPMHAYLTRIDDANRERMAKINHTHQEQPR